MSCVVWKNIYNLKILYFHDSMIVNTHNYITYNRGSHEYLTTTLYIKQVPKRIIKNVMWSTCLQYVWNKVEITLRMFQIRVSQARYVGIPICSDRSVNSMFGFARINGINMLELYLNSRHRRESSSSMELTWFSNNSERTI